MNTYTWNIKNLNKDQKGYANSLYLEMSGSNEEKIETASIAFAFGGDEYKPYNSWTEEEIDAYAAEHEELLKSLIDEKLEGYNEQN